MAQTDFGCSFDTVAGSNRTILDIPFDPCSVDTYLGPDSIDFGFDFVHP
jgi:hypothetical protein